MERIKKVTVYCLKNSSIIIPIIIMEILIAFINQFGDYSSTETNLFDFFSNPFENADKLYTTLLSLSLIIADNMKHTIVPFLLNIFNYLIEETLLLGMVFLSLKHGFSSITDYWKVLKKYAWKVILVYLLFYIIIVLLLVGSFLLMTKILYIVGEYTLLMLLTVLGMLLLLAFMIVFFIYITPYAAYSIIEQGKVKKAMGRFFKDSSRCWFRIFPVMIALDVIAMILRSVFTNLDFLFLLDTLNTCVINTFVLFIQTVWMISVLYSYKVPEDMNAADELIIKKRNKRYNKDISEVPKA